MEREFWEEKWLRGELGFHQHNVCPDLLAYWSHFGALESGSQVFVPLCGKSLSMIWLRDQGFDVLGVELSAEAIEQFACEHNIAFEVTEHGSYKRHSSKNLSIIEGDIFAVPFSEFSSVKCVYDRAALIALPDTMRRSYADLLANILNQNQSSMLLVVIEYREGLLQAPPFSLSEEVLRDLFPQMTFQKLGGREKEIREGLESVRWISYQLKPHQKIMR